MILPKILHEPGVQTGGRQESDFLIINSLYKYIMALEVKYDLCSQSGGLDQISKIKMILEALFGNDIEVEVCWSS